MAKRTFRTLRERTQLVQSRATTKGPGPSTATRTAARVVGGRKTAKRGNR